MPIPFFLLALGLAVALLGVVAAFWPRILSWACDNVLPVIDRLVPQLADAVRLAFQVADSIITPIRLAWRRLTTSLVGMALRYVKSTSNKWIATMTSYVRTAEGTHVETVSESVVSWEDLPDDVRARAIRAGDTISANVDVYAARERELELELAE